MRSLAAALALCASTVAVSCGGGGGGGSGDTLSIPATTALSGSVDSLALYITPGGRPIVGDFFTAATGDEWGVRGFLSFDISSIPPTAVVVSATVRMTFSSSSGNGGATLDRLLMDQVVYGDVLDAGAYDRSFPI